MKPQVHPNHYTENYDSRRRFASYWHQIHEIKIHAQGPVLEIGAGNGFTAQYLRTHGLTVSTLDHDSQLNPDIIGDITNLQIPEKTYDIVAAFEVLEHVPYHEALKALKRMRDIAQRYVIISLPDSAHIYSFSIRLPFIGSFRKLFRVTMLPLKKSRTKDHYWELELRGFGIHKVRRDIKDIGFAIENEYSLFENPRHYFFILKKI